MPNLTPYTPVARFSCGEGEVCINGIECPLIALKLRLSQVVNEPVYIVSASINKKILPPRQLTTNQPEVIAELQERYPR